MVDCQPLAMVLNGETPWSNDWGGSEIHYTCNTLRQWVVRRGPLDLLAKPVEWRGRELNKMVGFISNKSMDTKSSWTVLAVNATELAASAVGIICFTDGGYRPKSGLAAAGWIVVAIVNNE